MDTDIGSYIIFIGNKSEFIDYVDKELGNGLFSQEYATFFNELFFEADNVIYSTHSTASLYFIDDNKLSNQSIMTIFSSLIMYLLLHKKPLKNIKYLLCILFSLMNNYKYNTKEEISKTIERERLSGEHIKIFITKKDFKSIYPHTFQAETPYIDKKEFINNYIK